MPGACEFELAGEGVAITYVPGDRLEVRRGGQLHIHAARDLLIEPVAVGQVISSRAADAFALLLPNAPVGGGELSAVALTRSPGAAGWRPTLMRGHAGAYAGTAAREAAPDGGDRRGGAAAEAAAKALPVTFTSTFAADKLLMPDSGAPEDDPSTDDEPPQPNWRELPHLPGGGAFDDPFGDDGGADDDPMLPDDHDMG
jgi:hypothetical protein